MSASADTGRTQGMRAVVEKSAGPKGTGYPGSNFYFPELDGLRCVAVLGVVFFHLKVPGMSVGGLGVWLFFVLSGYLITTILWNERSLNEGIGSFLGRFYCRRALRIFPLYYAYLFGIYALQIVSSGSSGRYDHFYFLTYTQNFLLGVTSFKAQPLLLGHTWSLAIEEQFYLVWPILVYYLSRRALTVICLLIVLCAPVYRYEVFAATGNPYLTYTISLGCADSLALGCLCALHWDCIARTNRTIVAAIAAVMLAFLVALVVTIGAERFWDARDWIRHPAQALVLSIAGITFAAITVGSVRFTWPTILRHPIIMHIGQISYGIYMWHGLAIVISIKLLERLYAGSPADEWVRIGAALVVIYLIAFASYQYLERPFLAMKNKFYARTESASVNANGRAS